MSNYLQPELLEFKLSSNEVIQYQPDIFMLKLELDTLGEDLNTDSDSKMTTEDSQGLHNSISLNMHMMLDQTGDTSSSLDGFDEDDGCDSLTLGEDLGLLTNDDESQLPSEVRTCEEIESFLHRELEEVKLSHQETSSRFETNALIMREELRTLEENLNNDREIINHLRAEKNDFQQEIMALKQKCDDNENMYKTELEQLRKELKDQAALNNQLHNKINEISNKAAEIEKEVKQRKKSGFCGCLS